MSKRKRPAVKIPHASGEIIEEDSPLPELTRINNLLGPIDRKNYLNRNQPSVRALIAISSEDQAEEALSIQKVLKDEIIDSSIIFIGEGSIPGTIKCSEYNLQKYIKMSCVVLCMTEDYLEEIQERTFLAGRFLFTWKISRKEHELSTFTKKLKNLNFLPAYVRNSSTRLSKGEGELISKTALDFKEK